MFLRAQSGKNVLWQEMLRHELLAALEQRPVVIVPVGSVEQHGPHCPQDVDISIPYHLAIRAGHDVPIIRSALQEITGAATIPQIFIGGKWIGGSMEVLGAAESGQLQRLLEQNSIPFSHHGEVNRYDFLPSWVQKQPQAA